MKSFSALPPQSTPGSRQPPGAGQLATRPFAIPERPAGPVPAKAGIPERLRAGIERLSGGVSLRGVQVYYDSPEPSRFRACAYTQGTKIHMAPGREDFLAHEAWHVVQQRQGRVRPTSRVKGFNLNEDPVLEQEAEAMGERALQQSPGLQPPTGGARSGPGVTPALMSPAPVIQCGKTEKKKGARPHPYGYTPGQHGYKRHEQQDLSSEFGIRISGTTHESEHAIGFEPLNQTSGMKRGDPGRAHELEYRAPAYQEVKSLHREHIGTGTHSTPDETGLTSMDYRDYQRSLMEAGDISSAIQMNQLGYAFDPSFHTMSATREGQAANKSYRTMIGNMTSYTFARGGDNVTVPVDPRQQAEMDLARTTAQIGRYPTEEEEGVAKRRYGLL